MKYCQKCGTENTDESKFCCECGNAFTDVEKQNREDLSAENSLHEITDDSVTQNPISESAENKEVPTVTVSNIKSQKYVPILCDKEAVASLVLSIIGAIFPVAAPIQILALILGIKGLRSSGRKSIAAIGIGLSLFGMACFIAMVTFFIANYNLIISSDIFTYIFYFFFG